MNDHSVSITLEDGSVVRFTYGPADGNESSMRQSECLHYEPEEPYPIYCYCPKDLNGDNKVTYGECMSVFHYLGYDYNKNVPILYDDYTVTNTTYTFKLSNSSDKAIVHLEGRQNIDDWELKTHTGTSMTWTSYEYKYGNSLLYLGSQTGEFVNYAGKNPMDLYGNCGDKLLSCLLFRYNDKNSNWESAGSYVPSIEDAQFEANMLGDGIYICVRWFYFNFGELIDVDSKCGGYNLYFAK